MQIAQRASRLGYYVKSVITWAKSSTLPEPQNSRVSRTLEYILHFSTVRTPKFEKAAYRELAPSLGGRNPSLERDKLTDVWTFATSNGGDGHGAQFPIALPARCIALTTAENDIVLDPFTGIGTAGVAARRLGRRFVGIDVSGAYLQEASKKLADFRETLF
jgi:DNA modification methylase